MLTPAEIAKEATAQLKAAKTEAHTAKRKLPWSEVQAIILRCLEQAQSPASLPSSADKATVDAIYALYPRKVGRLAAVKAIGKAAMLLREREPDALAYLLERVRLYATAVAMWPESERHYCPHAATWFNQGRYDDNPKEWERAPKAAPASARDYSKI